MGTQPPIGLTPYFLYRSMTSWFCSALRGSVMLRFLYLALMASICGLSACIFRIDFMFEILSGNRIMLITMVTSTMAQPKLWTNASLNQLTTRNSGLARIDSQPKFTTCSSLGSTLLEQVVVLGTHEELEAVPRAIGDRHAGERRRLLERRAHGVGERGHLHDRGAALGQEDGGEIFVVQAGE